MEWEGEGPGCLAVQSGLCPKDDAEPLRVVSGVHAYPRTWEVKQLVWEEGLSKSNSDEVFESFEGSGSLK